MKELGEVGVGVVVGGVAGVVAGVGVVEPWVTVLLQRKKSRRHLSQIGISKRLAACSEKAAVQVIDESSSSSCFHTDG